MNANTPFTHGQEFKFTRLEAVRGFAAVYVCVGHVVLAWHSGGIAGCFRFGQEAVMVFFVLSGFVMAWGGESTAGRPKFTAYFLRRFMRIYSVWIVMFLALFVIESFEGRMLAAVPSWQLLGNLFMLQDFSAAKPGVLCDPVFGNTPLWSLHYEWWFYMLFPLVLQITSRRCRMHVVGMTAVVAAGLYVFYHNPVLRLMMYFPIWWIGAHAASCLRVRGIVKLNDLLGILCYVSAAACPLLLVCIFQLHNGSRLMIGIHPFLEVRHLLGAVALVVLACGWRRLGWCAFSHTVGLFSFAAPVSFSLYVMHYRGIAYAKYFGSIPNRMLELVAYVVVTLLICVISELWIYPLLRTWTCGRRADGPVDGKCVIAPSRGVPLGESSADP